MKKRFTVIITTKTTTADKDHGALGGTLTVVRLSGMHTSGGGRRATADPIMGITPKRTPPGPSLYQLSLPSRKSTQTLLHLNGCIDAKQKKNNEKI